MSEWISVEDRLPKHGDTIYTKSKDGLIYKSQMFDWHEGKNIMFKLFGYVWEHSNVTHWKDYDKSEAVSGYDS